MIAGGLSLWREDLRNCVIARKAEGGLDATFLAVAANGRQYRADPSRAARPLSTIKTAADPVGRGSFQDVRDALGGRAHFEGSHSVATRPDGVGVARR